MRNKLFWLRVLAALEECGFTLVKETDFAVLTTRAEAAERERDGMRRFANHYLGQLEYLQTGRDPKNNGFAYARVPDWALRQLLDPSTPTPSEPDNAE